VWHVGYGLHGFVGSRHVGSTTIHDHSHSGGDFFIGQVDRSVVVCVFFIKYICFKKIFFIILICLYEK
jgi:hypothetical protein